MADKNRAARRREERARALREPAPAPEPAKSSVSLLDRMQDGREYGSIVDHAPKDDDLLSELKRALGDLESVRQRPCCIYVANVFKGEAAINISDHLPFTEMVNSVPPDQAAVDVFLVTPGGFGHVVTQFVSALRPRFQQVDFILPYMAMSAGTLWALSGNHIWMDERAFIGPIDPQVHLAKSGRMVPAQTLLGLVAHLQQQGQEAINAGMDLPWSTVQLLNSIEPHELGDAINASHYAIGLATDYLNQFKFSGWTAHNPGGAPVTPLERAERAQRIATQLCNHERWKNHGHAISREVAWTELRIEIDRPESVPGFLKAIHRLWALCHYTLDKGPVAKLFLADNYVFFKLLGS